jgi:hypothetical protein
MPDLIPALSNQSELWPQLAMQPEAVRARFLSLTTWFARWLESSSDRRREVLTAAAIQLNASRTQLARTFHAVEKSRDFSAFLPRERSDRGSARAFDDHVLAYMQSRYMALREKLRAWEETVALFEGTGARIGSYRRACSYMRAWEQEAASAFTLEAKAKDYYDAYEVPILRDKSTLEPLEIICGDHHQFDIVIIWSDGTIVRPWVSAWVDVRTNMMLGHTITRTPDARSIADSLFTVMTRWGVPANVYVDNGKSYRAKILKGTKWQNEELAHIGGITAEAEQMLGLLHRGLYGESRLRHAIPYNSRAKVIERMFGTGGFSDFVKPMPGYTGRRYEDTPDETKRRIKTRNLLSLEDFLVALYHWTDRMNNRPSRGHGMGGASPRELMMWYMERGWRPRIPQDESMLLLLAMRTATRVVHRFGIQVSGVREDPMYYMADFLIRHIGKRVICKWAESDLVPREFFSTTSKTGRAMRMVPRAVHVFSEKDGKYLGQCEAMTRLDYIDAEALPDAMAKQRHQRKVVREEIDAIKNVGTYVSFGVTPDDLTTNLLSASAAADSSEDQKSITRASRSPHAELAREVDAARKAAAKVGPQPLIPATADPGEDEPFIL